MKRLALSVSLLVLFSGTPQCAAQANWADQLGFPSDKRVVILHGNDMGITYECSRPVQEGLSAGSLTSASAIAVGPWFAECADWARRHPEMDLGLSLSFVNPSAAIRWSGAARGEGLESLVDDNGYFPKTVLQFHLRADIEAVRREAEAQIERAREMGLQPTHLHPHMGALLARPDLFRLYLQLAEEHWIPAVMVEFTPEVIARFRNEGLILDEEVLEAAARYALPKVDDIRNIPPAGSYDEKRQLFCDVVASLKPGITQIFLHPSDDTAGLRLSSDKWQDRVWEAQLLADPQVRDHLQQQEIVLTNWRELMGRFEAAQQMHDAEDE